MQMQDRRRSSIWTRSITEEGTKMTILQRLLEAWKSENYQATVECFTPSAEARFVDYAPSLIGQEPIHLYGNKTIEMYFRNVFYPMNRLFSISEVKELTEKEANYFACYRGRYVFVRLSVEETDENGRIVKAVVRPE